MYWTYITYSKQIQLWEDKKRMRLKINLLIDLHFTLLQCCPLTGVADPGCLSRIRIFPSWMPDPRSNKKEEGKHWIKNSIQFNKRSPISQNKIINFLKKYIWVNWQRICNAKKCYCALRNHGWIRDTGSRIRYTGSEIRDTFPMNSRIHTLLAFFCTYMYASYMQHSVQHKNMYIVHTVYCAVCAVWVSIIQLITHQPSNHKLLFKRQCLPCEKIHIY